MLRAMGHHLVEAVEQCGAEVAAFLSDLSNWQQPIFPDVTECSRLEIVPSYFNISSNFWNCDSQMAGGQCGRRDLKNILINNSSPYSCTPVKVIKKVYLFS